MGVGGRGCRTCGKRRRGGESVDGAGEKRERREMISRSTRSHSLPLITPSLSLSACAPDFLFLSSVVAQNGGREMRRRRRWRR